MTQTKITLKGLVFYARHGALKEEQSLGQRFVVDVVVALSDACAIETDRLDQTVNYASLYACIQNTFTAKTYHLIEACAHAVASEVLKAFEEIQAITVCVKKPSVPVDCVCDYFSAEVELKR